MIRVLVNEQPMPIDLGSVKMMGELIELIKASIDPDALIMSITLNGEELTDGDWRSPLSTFSGRTLALTTASRDEFIATRLDVAALYIERIRSEFAGAKDSFKKGVSSEAHTSLSQAVQDLKAFTDWYGTIVAMLPTGKEGEVTNYKEQIKRITEVCEQLLQQQLYRAWWALAETIERKLDPELERLKGCCLKVANG